MSLVFCRLRVSIVRMIAVPRCTDHMPHAAIQSQWAKAHTPWLGNNRRHFNPYNLKVLRSRQTQVPKPRRHAPQTAQLRRFLLMLGGVKAVAESHGPQRRKWSAGRNKWAVHACDLHAGARLSSSWESS